ncbi:MAG: DUF92 domain-containing protein [Chloroflexi bacterium]|nr:DUF92 domain-containing protein [Chloroflexota bacterium]
MFLTNLLSGFVLSGIIAALAFWRGSLSTSGAIGTVIVGTLVFSTGSITWAILLVTFFVTSSALSHYKENVKAPLAEKFQKGHRRDLGQVLANGGIAALIAIAFTVIPHRWHFIGFIGAIATVTADTWATELGVLSKTPPRLITTGRRVPVGTSGGISRLGVLIAFCGALLIGLVAFIAEFSDTVFWHRVPFIPQSLWLIPIGAFAGLLGSLFDSFLGATVQGIYYCDFDHKETESKIHRCGHKTRLIRGWRWLDNDGVNFLSSFAGSLIALGIYLALG